MFPARHIKQKYGRVGAEETEGGWGDGGRKRRSWRDGGNREEE